MNRTSEPNEFAEKEDAVQQEKRPFSDFSNEAEKFL
jgi:hypothetical protein